jgi:hypothetical protein
VFAMPMEIIGVQVRGLAIDKQGLTGSAFRLFNNPGSRNTIRAVTDRAHDMQGGHGSLSS